MQASGPQLAIMEGVTLASQLSEAKTLSAATEVYVLTGLSSWANTFPVKEDRDCTFCTHPTMHQNEFAEASAVYHSGMILNRDVQI